MNIEQLMNDLTNPELSRYHEAAKIEIRKLIAIEEPITTSVDEWCDIMGLWVYPEERKNRQSLGRIATKICSHTNNKIVDRPNGSYGNPLATYPDTVLIQAKTRMEQT